MNLDNFIDKFFLNLVDEKGVNLIKDTIKKQMENNDMDYNKTKVEPQVLTEYANFDPRVEISSEGYSDGEIVFIDYYLD